MYAAALAAAALGTGVALSLRGDVFGDPTTLLTLAAIAALAERGCVRLSASGGGATIEESISLLPVLFAAVVLGPVEAMLVAVASNIWDLKPQPGVTEPYLKWGVYTATRAITAAATGFVAAAVLDRAPEGELGAIAMATLAGALTAHVLDVGFVLLTVKVRGTVSPKEVWQTLAPMLLASIPLSTPVVAVLAFAFLEVSHWTLPLFFVPALAAHRSFVLYHEQRTLTDDLVAANDRLEHANLSFATALVATLEARDEYTAGHSAAVATYAREIAARMGLPDTEQRLAHLCGLVHDVGKIGLPAALLEKAGPLTLAERRQMQGHSMIGEHILNKVDDYGEIATIVRHHHERVDGTGYPDRLAGDEIPLISRIISVADAFDAMTSDRPYRDAMPSRVARLRLAQAVESQFDTSVVAAFEAILAATPDERRQPEDQFVSPRPALAAVAIS
jgi:putative nucleotidyltransferase with HDIG domain